MPRTPIIPDSEIVLTPLEPHLCVVVLRNEIEQVRQKQVRLVFCDAVDTLGEAFVDVK